MNYKLFLKNLFWEYRKLFNPKLIRNSNQFWMENRNIHKGKRGFIIGNGPSLKISDLDKLKNEITIASNKIYLAFEETDWRPSFFTVFDRLLWNEIKNEVYKYINIPVILSHDRLFPNTNKSVLIKNNGFFETGNQKGFSKNIIDGVWSGRTITYTNIQIAIHLGLNPIYLIGCDHYYIEKKPESHSSTVVTHQNQQNHFIEGYRKEGQKVNFAPIDIMTRAYQNASDNCDELGVKIFNATRGGHLEIFTRKNFDEAIQ